jgi:hypothetical protein
MSNEVKEIKSILDELISILLSSCTQIHDDGVVQHDHDMFDSCDINRLKELRKKLDSISI